MNSYLHCICLEKASLVFLDKRNMNNSKNIFQIIFSTNMDGAGNIEISVKCSNTLLNFTGITDIFLLEYSFSDIDKKSST